MMSLTDGAIHNKVVRYKLSSALISPNPKNILKRTISKKIPYISGNRLF